MMRKTAFAVACALVTSASAGLAGTPATATLEDLEDDRLTPITATFPPMSESEISQRCRGFFRAIALRHKLARSMGVQGGEALDFVADLPPAALHVADEEVDYVTPYMVEFGPLNPRRTVKSGLFAADRKTCTAFLDAMG